jgi:hypothetical protein
MLWLRHGDKLLFRTGPTQAFEPGTFDWIRVPNRIIDQFGYIVPGRIIYEGDVCDPTLPDTFAGLPAFTIIQRSSIP